MSEAKQQMEPVWKEKISETYEKKKLVRRLNSGWRHKSPPKSRDFDTVSFAHDT